MQINSLELRGTPINVSLLNQKYESVFLDFICWILLARFCCILLKIQPLLMGVKIISVGTNESPLQMDTVVNISTVSCMKDLSVYIISSLIGLPLVGMLFSR